MATFKQTLDDLAILFGSSAREAVESFGSIGMMLFKAFAVKPRINIILEQMMRIGVESLPIVVLASVFTGFIATWQVYCLAGEVFGLSYLGMIVLKVVLVELGPTLIGLVLAGRISAKLAAEVGTMRVTEQIDAMTCLSLDPMSYIVAPRVISGFISMPVNFIFGSVAAIVSAQILATTALDLPAATFYNSTRMMFDMANVWIGLAKSFVFGGIISLAGTYYGFYTTGGAVGVGASTRQAVVAASILILIFNLIISQLMVS